MTLEVESHFGGCVLSGPDLSREALEGQIAHALREGGGSRDGFIAALGRSGWRTAESGLRPQYRYDLDIEKLFEVEY